MILSLLFASQYVLSIRGQKDYLSSSSLLADVLQPPIYRIKRYYPKYMVILQSNQTKLNNYIAPYYFFVSTIHDFRHLWLIMLSLTVLYFLSASTLPRFVSLNPMCLVATKFYQFRKSIWYLTHFHNFYIFN